MPSDVYEICVSFSEKQQSSSFSFLQDKWIDWVIFYHLPASGLQGQKSNHAQTPCMSWFYPGVSSKFDMFETPELSMWSSC